MRVLVTGAAGFIGFFLCQKLLKRGDSVIGLDNLNDYYDVNLKKSRLEKLIPYSNFRFIKQDLFDRSGLAETFKQQKPDRVVNLAAQAGVR